MKKTSRSEPRLKLIRDEREYRAALQRIEETWDPEAGTPEAEIFERLCDAVVAYEKEEGAFDDYPAITQKDMARAVLRVNRKIIKK